MMSLLIVTLLAIGAWNYTSAEKFDTEACVIFYPNKNWGGNNYSICASDDKCHDVYGEMQSVRLNYMLLPME